MLDKLIDKRRSYRALKKTEITTNIIEKLAKTAQLAPSCYNYQPWNFIFVYEEDKLTKLKETLSSGNAWAKKASMIVAVFTKKELDCISGKTREYYLYDTGMAVGFMLLKATELGLVIHPIAGYSENKAKEVLNVPKDMQLINLLIVGEHDKTYGGLTESQVVTEKKRPKRKSLNDFVYHKTFTEKNK
ncbi:MAG: nitroreductase family protein [Asgard group archaeon]|nr:nitroreductase family protein [Asgard group archaeon]